MQEKRDRFCAPALGDEVFVNILLPRIALMFPLRLRQRFPRLPRFALLFLIAQVTMVCLCVSKVTLAETLHHQTEQTNQQESDALPELKLLPPGIRPPVESLGPGESHSYRIRLEANQYIRVQGYFYGVDAAMTLYSPGGEKLEEVLLPTSTEVQKSLMWTSKVAGVYRFEVRTLAVAESKGRYHVAPERWLDVNRENEDLIAADRASYEGFRLQSIGTEEALREAIEKFQAAVPRWHDLNERRLDYKYKEYESLMFIGETHFKLSEYQESLAPYQQALVIKQKAGWATADVWAYNNIARSYQMLGESEQALKYFQMSVAEVEGPREDKSDKEYAVAYTALGAFYLGSGEKEKALEYLHRAIPYWRSPKGNSAGTPDVDGEARVLLRLGKLYASLGQTNKAIEYLQHAAATWRATSDPVWLVRALNSLGQTQFDLGDLNAALATFNEALQVSRKSGSKENQAYALANLGQVNLSLGAQGEALDYLQQALALMEAIGNRGGQAYVLSKLGLLTRAQGKPREALGYFARGLELREAVRDREGTAQALYQLALNQRDLGDLEAARGHIERALSLIEFVRASFSGPEMRSAYLSSTRSYYEFYVDLLMRLHERSPASGYDSKAFEASEHARARTLLETLVAAGIDIREGAPSELLQRERSIEQRLKAKSEYETRLLSSSPQTPPAEAAAREVDALAEEYRDIRAQIRAASPRYAALTQPEPLAVKEIQSQVLDADTVLLEYALGEERSFLWLVTRDSISAFRLPNRTVIEKAARGFYLGLSAPTASERAKGPAAARQSAEINETAETLSEMLLGPVRDRLGNKRLLIVAEGTLQYIPFAALTAPKNGPTSFAAFVNDKLARYQPLTAQHEIISLPSASSLVLLRKEIRSRPSPPKMLAALADPVFDPSDPRVLQSARDAGASRDNKTASIGGSRTLAAINFDVSLRDSGTATNGIIPRLPSTRREALAIASLIPAQQRQLALDFDASRATALSGVLSNYRILHFATHGLIDSQRPELSGLVLSLVDKDGRPQDGFLQVHEIYNLKLPADLVVLSACRTALGNDVKGEGLLGVTRGFMYAGAARIVSSLWEVDSRATAELMTRFYREMLTNKRSPAAALRAAQVSMAKDPRWHAPYYWAGFIIQGEYR